MKKTMMKTRKTFGTLTQEHIDYLTDQQTLEEWAGKSLETRAVLFHRQYGEVKISAGQLFNVYRKNGIRYKLV